MPEEWPWYNILMKIGVFDSGMGGMTTFREIRELSPNEDVEYYADFINHPYGNKTDEELDEITTNVVRNFVNGGAEMIVIACNTATTKCIRKLREKFPGVIFVGTEPAVKPACDDGNKNILVLVTPVTAGSEQLERLITNNKKEDQNITVVPCHGLAEAVETRDEAKIQDALDKNLHEYVGGDYDAVVLGCTHYVLIKDEIQKMFANAKLYDGNKGVAKRVKAILEEQGWRARQRMARP